MPTLLNFIFQQNRRKVIAQLAGRWVCGSHWKHIMYFCHAFTRGSLAGFNIIVPVAFVSGERSSSRRIFLPLLRYPDVPTNLSFGLMDCSLIQGTLLYLRKPWLEFDGSNLTLFVSPVLLSQIQRPIKSNRQNLEPFVHITRPSFLWQFQHILYILRVNIDCKTHLVGIFYSKTKIMVFGTKIEQTIISPPCASPQHHVLFRDSRRQYSFGRCEGRPTSVPSVAFVNTNFRAWVAVTWFPQLDIVVWNRGNVCMLNKWKTNYVS